MSIIVFFSNMSGEKNSVYSTDVFKFYLALSATYQKSFEFLSKNICGPGIRQIQRMETRDECYT